MWRWSLVATSNELEEHVFSTYVEVILLEAIVFRSLACILHVCGGDPDTDTTAGGFAGYSPRMWRWSYASSINAPKLIVFSTYVEVILFQKRLAVASYCILHVCGGDPNPSHTSVLVVSYSPRMWRWSSSFNRVVGIQVVFSTYVEVILSGMHNLLQA